MQSRGNQHININKIKLAGFRFISIGSDRAEVIKCQEENEAK